MDAIERAARFYDCKTRAVMTACDDVAHLSATARQALERDGLTLE
ncbi:hypothetical protein SAMN05421809_3474 [Natronorubrum daqingense]|uniref:DUF7692 domain-containing protein n=1 Tax=Natronorubrum daqingense TaxID=588898 RepID=A0A1N7FSV3_9EURY|nr:hypothetical protein [Natronorubrum daqingense]SIS03401.1 hypothetical protein SAMN05421809_3474 [Natronorubrum daqingense]